MRIYKIKLIDKSLFSRTYEVFSSANVKLARITQSASEYDNIVTSEGKKFLVGGDISINLWMECPDGTVYETKLPTIAFKYTYFIQFDGREITFKGGDLFEGETKIGEIKKELQKSEGIKRLIQLFAVQRNWIMELERDIPEHIVFFIIWIFLHVRLHSSSESRQLKTLILEKERKRLKKINLKDESEQSKISIGLGKLVKILVYIFIFVGVASLLLITSLIIIPIIFQGKQPDSIKFDGIVGSLFINLLTLFAVLIILIFVVVFLFVITRLFSLWRKEKNKGGYRP